MKNKKRLFWILATILLIWLFPWILYLVITILGFVIWFMIKNPDTSDLKCGYADQEDINDDFYFIEYREAEEQAREEERKRRFTDDFYR